MGESRTQPVNKPPVTPPVVQTPAEVMLPPATPNSPAPASSSYTAENFPYEQYFVTDPYGAKQGSVVDQNDKNRAYKAYVNSGSTWKPPAPTSPGTPSTPPSTSIVPGQPVPGSGQVNVADYGSKLIMNPSLGMTPDNPNTPQNESTSLVDRNKAIDAGTPGTTVTSPGQNQPIQATTQQATAAQQSHVAAKTAQTYQAKTSIDDIMKNGQMTAAQGEIDPNHLIDAPQLDMQGMSTGTNVDGSTNYTGQALQQYAKQNISNIIDTSTAAGKALAQQLGDGNYTDSKATLKGQLEILQSEFTGPDGQPKIPGWAAGTARSVSQIAAFKGMSGTAATAAMSQALMEASIPIAQQDAQFFQTVTLQNLSNKQASTLNRANVLAKFDLANLDNRMTAAVENSKAFLAMDMANLNNRQQAEVINTQARVQSILEDSKQENAQRLFTAQSANDMNKFYESLNSSISQFNVAQQNGMSQFNASQVNNTSQFNASLENNRDQFYKNMQYNVDVANAKWRQTVTLQNNQNSFEAAATDVKNMTSMSQEQLNQLWDRSDSLLDYAWQSSEKALDRKATLAMAQFNASQANKAGIGQVVGSITGNLGGKLLDWAFA